jgi:Family of unknown function (DUF6338)
MDLSISTDNIATIIAVIAPGYFAIQAYSSVYAKAEKDFSRLLVESIAYGLLIVSLYNGLWHLVSDKDTLQVLSIGYFLPLFVVAWLAGAGFSLVRGTRPIRWLARVLQFPSPDDDFIRVQFKKLPPASIVTIALKSGEIFSGTPESLSSSSNKHPQRLYFSNIAWFNKKRKRGQWEVRNGSIIIAVEDILYIETDVALPKIP